MQNYKGLDLQRTANALIGVDPLVVDDYLIRSGVDTRNLQLRCNFTDMCDDSDAILLAEALRRIRQPIYMLFPMR